MNLRYMPSNIESHFSQHKKENLVVIINNNKDFDTECISEMFVDCQISPCRNRSITIIKQAAILFFITMLRKQFCKNLKGNILQTRLHNFLEGTT